MKFDSRRLRNILIISAGQRNRSKLGSSEALHGGRGLSTKPCRQTQGRGHVSKSRNWLLLQHRTAGQWNGPLLQVHFPGPHLCPTFLCKSLTLMILRLDTSSTPFSATLHSDTVKRCFFFFSGKFQAVTLRLNRCWKQ